MDNVCFLNKKKQWEKRKTKPHKLAKKKTEKKHEVTCQQQQKHCTRHTSKFFPFVPISLSFLPHLVLLIFWGVVERPLDNRCERSVKQVRNLVLTCRLYIYISCSSLRVCFFTPVFLLDLLTSNCRGLKSQIVGQRECLSNLTLRTLSPPFRMSLIIIKTVNNFCRAQWLW